MQRFLIDRPGPSPTSSLTEFYREEFVKHQRCLEEQREYFSDSGDRHVESALVKVISQVDSAVGESRRRSSRRRLLREFDVVTGCQPGPIRTRPTDETSTLR